MANSGKEAVRLCERIVRQAFGDVVCVSYLFYRSEQELTTSEWLRPYSTEVD